MEFTFTPENLNRINEVISHYPEKRPAVMGVLYIAQEQNGWISYEVMKEVANVLDMKEEEILGIVSFYTMYHEKPVGKFHLQVCTNVSCMLRGGYKIYDHVKEKLGIENDGVTEDKLF
ncbi:MAG: NADH-quinone oxidoreductase subunit NuoE family protein, partial [Ignavibacteriaceae bacterium]